MEEGSSNSTSMREEFIAAGCIALVLTAIIFIFSYTKWASITNTKYSTVYAKVIDAEYNTSFITYGNSMYASSTNYTTYLEYDGSIYIVNDNKMYYECKNRIGQFVETELVETYFVDGSIERSMRAKGDNDG